MTTSPKSSANIDVETVKHIAMLVRLGISEAEALEFSRQFTSIIDYFRMLNEVDTSGVAAAVSADAESRLREDVIKPSMSRDEFLAAAPHTESGFVRVPLVLGPGESGESGSEG